MAITETLRKQCQNVKDIYIYIISQINIVPLNIYHDEIVINNAAVNGSLRAIISLSWMWRRSKPHHIICCHLKYSFLQKQCFSYTTAAKTYLQDIMSVKNSHRSWRVLWRVLYKQLVSCTRHSRISKLCPSGFRILQFLLPPLSKIFSLNFWEHFYLVCK